MFWSGKLFFLALFLNHTKHTSCPPQVIRTCLRFMPKVAEDAVETVPQEVGQAPAFRNVFLRELPALCQGNGVLRAFSEAKVEDVGQVQDVAFEMRKTSKRRGCHFRLLGEGMGVES